MPKANVLTTESFEDLLALFSDDREVAGVRYEQMRAGLVRFFDFRGCTDPEALADDTINRVALKAGACDGARTVRLTAFFYGFAANVLMEYRRRAKREVPLVENNEVPHDHAASENNEKRDVCLTACLEKLPDAEREMIVEYYAFEGEKKLETRAFLCERLGCSPGTLYTKIFRIKAELRGCIKKCLFSV